MKAKTHLKLPKIDFKNVDYRHCSGINFVNFEQVFPSRAGGCKHELS